MKNQAGTLLKKINTSSNLTGLDRDIHTGGGTKLVKAHHHILKIILLILVQVFQTLIFL